MDITSYLVGASPYDNGFTLNYGDGDYSLESYPLLIPSSLNDFQHTLKEGETLQNIAYGYYGDSGKWYIIAEYNNIINPFTELKGGMVLMIPAYGS